MTKKFKEGKIKRKLMSILLTGALTLGASNLEAKITSYSSGYGFPNYKTGLLNKQNNWQSGSSFNKGWQVINITPKKDSLLSLSNNVLSFIPSNFKTFSSKDNHATFHFHTNKPIKYFTLSGEYNIQKNGYIDLYISGDNKNWAKIEHFDSRGRDNYRIGWTSTPYHANVNPFWRGLRITAHPYTKIKNDLYIKHSSGAKSNENSRVEIWRLSVSVRE